MATDTEDRRGIPWYVGGDRYAYIGVTVLLLAICAGCAAIAALSAPTVGAFVRSLQPQPTPTLTSSEAGTNVALRKPVTVSAEIPGFLASMAVDARADNWWGSGAFAPQWLEIDLQGQYVISEIRLLPSQDPPGHTTHRLLIRGTYTDDSYFLLHTFDGFTEDGRWITLEPPEPIPGVRFVRIESTSSPSWISWREINIISGD